MHELAAISELWRYPVKSMLGERCSSLVFDHRGVAGDRGYAVRDVDGKLGSGKTSRRFAKIEGLADFRAAYSGPHVEITFPSGATLRVDDATIDDALAASLGQPVTLVTEADVSHLDAAPVHLLTTASIAWLRAGLPDVGIDERRFRPNVLIEVPGSGPTEIDWIGKRLRIGRDVELSVIAPTKRCSMVAMAQADLIDEPRVLREITQRADLCFGVYANVVNPGIVRLNDRVSVLAG